MTGARSRDPVVALFGRRMKRAREAQEWSARELARRSGLSASTVVRAEAASLDMNLSTAARVAGALSIPLSELVAEAICRVCDGIVPTGFTCNECGRAGGQL